MDIINLQREIFKVLFLNVFNIMYYLILMRIYCLTLLLF